MAIIHHRRTGGTTYTGGHIRVYGVMTLRSSLRMYAETGLRPTSRISPGDLLKAAGRVTGKTYSRGRYEEAIHDLTAWIDAELPNIPKDDPDV